MKNYIINYDSKRYRVTAEDEAAAKKALKIIVDEDKDDNSIIESLILNEHATIAAYNVALNALKNEASDEVIAKLIEIRDDEMEHIAELKSLGNKKQDSVACAKGTDCNANKR